MARKKISIEEAFAVFEQAGLQVEVKAVVQPEPPTLPPAGQRAIDFVDQPPIGKSVRRVGTTTVQITLHTRQSVASGGHMVPGKDGETLAGQGIRTYGPGPCYVPTHLAGHLLYQDMLAKQADQRMLDPTTHYYLVVPRRGAGGMVHVGVEVDDLNLNATKLSDMYFV